MKRLLQTQLTWGSPTAPPTGSAASTGGPSTAAPLQLRRSFSQIWSEPANDQGLEVDHEILEETLQEGLNRKRKWESKATYRRPTGGRLKNEKLGLESRGTAGGWGSNRLYAGMERRRQDCSAAEGVELCQKVLELRAGGADAVEVNKYLLKHCCTGINAEGKQRRLRSLKNIVKKGTTFWKARQLQVQVGKHGLRKKGGVLKRACRSSEARGCRAPGGGRHDRFAAYKAAVKKTFTLELENGQEVCGVPGFAARPAHNAFF